MPSFYHLKLELYPYSDSSTAGKFQIDRERVWLPPPGTSVFDDLLSTSSISPTSSTSTTTWDSARHFFRDSLVDPARLNTTLDSNTDSNDRVGPRAPGPVSFQRQSPIVPERRWPEGPPTHSTSNPVVTAPKLQTPWQDWRFGRVSIETIDPTISSRDMTGEASQAGPSAAPTLGPSYGGAGPLTKATFVHVETKSTEVGWGVVHFYRDGDAAADTLNAAATGENKDVASEMDDCTTLCIPAVPAYMSPSDFLGFVGDGWRNELSHCRLVMTSRMNRYLALLKFRESKVAIKWKREFDGKVFNSIEPQLCHVVFVKSITFETSARFRRADVAKPLPLQPSSSAVSNSLRPFPPPTPNLIELPTCPVCLERMDETNGLMTIPCSHVFHCSCLQDWKSAGCPVCRFTNASGPKGPSDDPGDPDSRPFGSSISNLCSVCDCADDLWICLICGYVGCGRYKGGHAKDHWKETAHCFALELETQHVWDYAGDMWVHRLIRDKGDGKVVELPGRSNQSGQTHDEDVVPRAKLDSISLEYMHLISSQLESQRAYYEDMISKAADKAAMASSTAESHAAQSRASMEKINALEAKRSTLSEEVAQLERDIQRERNKASKSESLARNLSKSLQEEKRVTEGLMKRIEHLGRDNQLARKQVDELKRENEEQKELNRDLTMFISSQEKLKELEKDGKVEEGELESGTAGVAEKKGKRKGRR